MDAFLFYILKSTFCLGLFYVLFRALMSRSTFFRFNRITLLIGVSSCMLLPSFELTTEGENVLNVPFQTVQQALTKTTATISIDNGQPVKEEQNLTDGLPLVVPANGLLFLCGGIYLLGACAVFTLFLFSTIRMFHLIRGADKRKYGKYTLALTAQSVGSFSWGRYIVMSKADYGCHPDEILLHEVMHLRNRHTLDLLLAQVFLIIHWFNPAMWLLRQELQDIHEYEADNGVIDTGIDATRYQLLLVKKAVGTRLYSMANGFNHSKLKNRITMMLKEKTSRWARLKLLLFVPVVAGALYAFAQPEVKNVLQQVNPKVQQEKADDYVSLVKFFKEEEALYYERIYGTRTPETVIVKKKQVHQVLVNANNVILFDNAYPSLDGLKEAIKKKLMKSWEESGRKDAQMIYVVYDRAADIGAITSILREAKSAFDEMRADLAAASGDKSKKSLDKLCPYMLSEDEARGNEVKALPKDEKIEGIVVTLQTKEGAEIVENFTLRELEQKATAASAKMADTDHFAVSLKIDKDSKMGPVAAVKSVLRKVYTKYLIIN